MTAFRTTDRGAIRRWAEARGGVPAMVRGTGDLLRLAFGGARDPMLEEVSWARWFQVLEAAELVFVGVSDEGSRFHKVTTRETARR